MDLERLLERVLGEKEGLVGLRVDEVRESPCTQPGDNYMSDVRGAEVLGVLAGGQPYRKRLFVKRPITAPGFGDIFRVGDAFSNEATTYLELFPLYDVTMPCARCYHADSDVIVLEDLRCEGYVMGERCRGFDLETSGHVVKALAKYHAASFHAKATKKEEFARLTSLLKVVGVNTSSNAMMLEGLLTRIHSQVSEDPEFKPFLEFIKPLEGRVYEVIQNMRKASGIEVVSHGDCWINNILVRPGDADPVRLVDLQAGALTAPAVDVYSFLYTSLQPSVMDGEIEDLLQLYCKSFVDELTALKTPEELIPSAEDVMGDLTSRELYGFIIANLYLPAISIDPSSLPDINSVSKEDMANESFMDSIQCNGMKERLGKLISVCSKRGVFDKPLNEILGSF